MAIRAGDICLGLLRRRFVTRAWMAAVVGAIRRPLLWLKFGIEKVSSVVAGADHVSALRGVMMTILTF